MLEREAADIFPHAVQNVRRLVRISTGDNSQDSHGFGKKNVDKRLRDCFYLWGTPDVSVIGSIVEERSTNQWPKAELDLRYNVVDSSWKKCLIERHDL